jgi:hypothetical protein
MDEKSGRRREREREDNESKDEEGGSLASEFGRFGNAEGVDEGIGNEIKELHG